MRGKYITTVIMMAALSGSKKTRKTSETLASLDHHQLIWTKQKQNNTTAFKEKRNMAVCASELF